MPAYMIFVVDDVHDQAAMDAYRAAGRPAVMNSIAKFLCGPKVAEVLEGPEVDSMVALEFPDMESARAFYHSDAYQAAAPLRQAISRSRVFLIEGR